MVADKDTPKFSVLTHLILWDWKTQQLLPFSSCSKWFESKNPLGSWFFHLEVAPLLNSHSRTQMSWKCWNWACITVKPKRSLWPVALLPRELPLCAQARGISISLWLYPFGFGNLSIQGVNWKKEQIEEAISAPEMCWVLPVKQVYPYCWPHICIIFFLLLFLIKIVASWLTFFLNSTCLKSAPLYSTDIYHTSGHIFKAPLTFFLQDLSEL